METIRAHIPWAPLIEALQTEGCYPCMSNTEYKIEECGPFRVILDKPGPHLSFSIIGFPLRGFHYRLDDTELLAFPFLLFRGPSKPPINWNDDNSGRRIWHLTHKITAEPRDWTRVDEDFTGDTLIVYSGTNFGFCTVIAPEDNDTDNDDSGYFAGSSENSDASESSGEEDEDGVDEHLHIQLMAQAQASLWNDPAEDTDFDIGPPSIADSDSETGNYDADDENE